MPDFNPEILTAFLAVTVVLGLLVTVVIAFAFLFQRRQFLHRQEKAALAEAYARELLQAQIETQNQTLQQVGDDLHDNIGQLLTVVKMQLGGLSDELRDTPHHPAFVSLLDLLRTTIQEVRQLSKTVDTEAIHRAGLHDSLILELERIGRTGRYQTNLDVTGAPYSLNSETETILFRMAQEALQNAIKHAHAQVLTVTVKYQPDQFVLSIADNGRGFSNGIPTGTRTGSGVHNLHRRAGILGGTCRIASQPGQGTQVLIAVPHTE